MPATTPVKVASALRLRVYTTMFFNRRNALASGAMLASVALSGARAQSTFFFALASIAAPQRCLSSYILVVGRAEAIRAIERV